MKGRKERTDYLGLATHARDRFDVGSWGVETSDRIRAAENKLTPQEQPMTRKGGKEGAELKRTFAHS